MKYLVLSFSHQEEPGGFPYGTPACGSSSPRAQVKATLICARYGYTIIVGMWEVTYQCVGEIF